MTIIDQLYSFFHLVANIFGLVSERFPVICPVVGSSKIDGLGVTTDFLHQGILFVSFVRFSRREIGYRCCVVAKSIHSNMITDRLLSTLARKKVSQLVFTCVRAAMKISPCTLFLDSEKIQMTNEKNIHLGEARES